MSRPSPTQEQIDLALQLLQQMPGGQKQEKAVSVKHVTAGVAAGGLILTLALKFWFGAVSALPFLFTQGWHDQVQKNLEVSQEKFTEVEVLKANQAAMQAAIVTNQVTTAAAISEIKGDVSYIRRALERRNNGR